MTAVHSLLFWFRASIQPEDPQQRRMDGIRVLRLDRPVPTVSVFSARRVAASRG